LNSPIDEHILVEIPDGTTLPPGDIGVYKLLKSLYGLKQAPLCWKNLINQYLIAKKFARLEADPFLYVKEVTFKKQRSLADK
jgi:Reverse transcriptase (RNA-dependent DNA polymerase)